MKIPFFAISLLTVLSGCTEFYGSQRPAPVYGSPGFNPYEEDVVRTYPANRASEPDIITSTKMQNSENPEITPLTDEGLSQYQFRPQSPAVVALMSESERNQRAGDLDSAVAVMERALRIDPRNPTLTYKLAELRLKQEKPRLAEDLGKKAALLAAGDIALKKKSWLLISEARRRQQNYVGAKEAKLKAQSFVIP